MPTVILLFFMIKKKSNVFFLFFCVFYVNFSLFTLSSPIFHVITFLCKFKFGQRWSVDGYNNKRVLKLKPTLRKIKIKNKTRKPFVFLKHTVFGEIVGLVLSWNRKMTRVVSQWTQDMYNILREPCIAKR